MEDDHFMCESVVTSRGAFYIKCLLMDKCTSV